MKRRPFRVPISIALVLICGLVVAILYGRSGYIPPISRVKASVTTVAKGTSNSLQGIKSSKPPRSIDPRYVPGELIVKYRAMAVDTRTILGRATVLSYYSSRSLSEKEALPNINGSLLKITDGKSVEAKMAELKSNPSIEYVEPNYKRAIESIATNDPGRGELWGLDNTGQSVNGISGTAGKDIDAPESWSINEGQNASITVAVLDTGVDYNHPDLAANMWDGTNCKDENGAALGSCIHGYDFEDGDKIPLPTSSSHGTHVAGTIAAVKNNAIGVVGVAPHAKIMALKFGMDTASEVRAIDFATQNGAKVINASFGGDYYSQSEFDAINRFKVAGGIFVAAAGNGGADIIGDNNDITPFYPANYNLSNIISVAATDQNDALASFSNYGVGSVDVGAPGVNILSSVADSVAMSENFQGVVTPAVPAGWTKGGINNKWGTANENGNKLLYGQVPGFPYDDNTNSTIDSPTYDISSTTGATLSFDASCDTQYSNSAYHDYMALEYSKDGGATYTEDLRWDEYDLDSDTDPSGSAQRSYEEPIPPQYFTNNFRFRYRWVTDATDNNYAGCSVDNIFITKFSGTNNYAYYSGTSMATPHVVGEVALIEGYKPALTSDQVKNIVMTTGDNDTSLVGKTVTGKRINAKNALNEVTGPSFTVQYYLDAGLSVPWEGSIPIFSLYRDNVYLKISSDQALLASPTITIDSEGTTNDVVNAQTTHLTGNDYLLTRHISRDQATTGTTQETIRITGSSSQGTSNAVAPTNESLQAAEFMTHTPTLVSAEFVKSSEVPYNDQLKLVFDIDINHNTIWGDNIGLVTSGRFTVSSLAYSGDSVGINISNLGDLEATTNDMVLGAGAVSDDFGNPNILQSGITVTDHRPPKILTAQRIDTGNQVGIQAGDKVVITFTKPMNQEVINASNIDNKLPLVEYIPDPIGDMVLGYVRTWKDGAGNIGGAIWLSSTVLQITLSCDSGAPALVTSNTFGLDFGYSTSRPKDVYGDEIINGLNLSGSFDPVIGPLDHIIISPNTTQNILTGQTVNFTAQGQDANNNNISGLTYTWSGTNSSNSGTFSRANPGIFYVSVSSGGKSSSTVTVNVTSPPAPVLSKLHVDTLTSTSATVSWDTDIPSTTQVYYCLYDAQFSNGTTLDSSLVTHHTQTISGLAPATRYQFFPQSTSALGALGTGISEFTTFLSPQLPFRSGAGNWNINATKFSVSGDFNNDGKSEVAGIYNYGDNDMGIWTFGGGSTMTPSSLFRSGKWNWNIGSTRFITAGDFNGDGKDDIAAMYDYGDNDMGIWLFLSNGTSFTPTLAFRSGKWNWNISSTRFLTSGDYNGDGKAEIGAMYDYGSNDMGIWTFGGGIYMSPSSPFRSGKWNWNISSTRFLTSGDYNGDGKAEIGAMYDYGSNDMGIWTFGGGSTMSPGLAFRSGSGNWNIGSTRFLTSGDYNGDGKAEIGAMYDYGSNDMGIWTFGGGSTMSPSSPFRSGKWNWNIGSTRFLTSGDYNGDGKAEIGAMYDYGSNDMGIWVF